MVVFLTAGLAQAAPPRMHRPFPHPGGHAIAHHFHHHPHFVFRPHNRAFFGGYGYYRGYGGYEPYYGYAYGQDDGGYGDYPYGYSYSPSFSTYGASLSVPATPAPSAEEKGVATVLAASGIPMDEGRPVWPLALRILPGPEAQALRGQIDSLLEVAAARAARGEPNTATVEELGKATQHLRKLLLRHREERGGFASRSYEEAGRFLDKLAGAQKLLR
jgi:hypothetical protein